MFKPIFTGKYRYVIVDTELGTKYSFPSVVKQAENHAKVLELLLDAQQEIEQLRLERT